MTKTKPEVFIVESLRFDDEKNNRYEGKMLSNILELNRKHSKYYYIRTKRELKEVVNLFSESNYRYLHLSCHGSAKSMATTLDSISFKELGKMIRPHLQDRRLFVSACEMVNANLAREIMPNSGCYSIIGPSTDIAFSDAAILWSSFYHLMFKRNFDVMKREEILRCCKPIANLFEVSLNYFGRDQHAGFRLDTIAPSKNGT